MNTYFAQPPNAKKQKIETNDTDAKSSNNNIIKINIKTTDIDNQFSGQLVIECKYSQHESISNILQKITTQVNKKYYPIKLKIYWIKDGFTGAVDSAYLKNVKKWPVTIYSKNAITNKGLAVELQVNYEHKIITESITCEYMNKLNSKDPLKCHVYHKMKDQYEFSKQHLNHLIEYSHFIDEYTSKPVCKYNDSCKAFIRMENGGHQIKDECHILLYRHPPRTKNIKLAQNIHNLIINKAQKQNRSLSYPSDDDQKKYDWTEKDGYLKALIEEVKANGFGYDLCLQCSKYDECKHDDGSSILQIVDDKMEHIRHKQMNKPLNRAQMLALILYTGCDCNYNLCGSQRNGDYKKWRWFDYCLYEAIRKLSNCESGSFSVFTGLNGVQLDSKDVQSAYFVTYVSSSWNKNVAKAFMGGKGMIIKIDEQFKNHPMIFCCDVSWISKFPDEAEILFGRSVRKSEEFTNNFKCSILDNSSGVQKISLSIRKK